MERSRSGGLLARPVTGLLESVTGSHHCPEQLGYDPFITVASRRLKSQSRTPAPCRFLAAMPAAAAAATATPEFLRRNLAGISKSRTSISDGAAGVVVAVRFRAGRRTVVVRVLAAGEAVCPPAAAAANAAAACSPPIRRTTHLLSPMHIDFIGAAS